MTPYLVLGIDPGSTATGWGLVAAHRDGRMTYVDCGIIRPGVRAFDRRLCAIYDQLGEVIDKHQPRDAVLESIFYAANVKSALKLGHARGVALLAAAHREIPVHEYSPMEIKKGLVGYGRAEKSQVAGMVGMLLGVDASRFALDATDALAVAICHINSSHLHRTAEVQGS